MHKYLRAIGFSGVSDNDELRKLLELSVEHNDAENIFDEPDKKKYGELKKAFAPGLGICSRGQVQNCLLYTSGKEQTAAAAEPEQIKNDFIYRDMEEKIKGIFGTKVSVSHKKNNKGKIEIEYYSNDELERIYDLITSIAKN